MDISNWKPPSFLIYVLALQAIVCITLILDIPIARQVLGFLYFTFIPGFILLRGFRLKNLDVTETILFSVGLSITFLMFIGLLTNELGSFLSKPLSTEPLAIIINITIILMCVLCCLKNEKDSNSMVPRGSSARATSLLTVPYLALPFLNVVGVMLVIAFKDNLLLILIIILIALLFLLSSFSPRFSSYYPLALVSIASTLLLNTFLASKYIYGHDTHLEYLIFKETRNISYWNYMSSYDSIRGALLNSMTSVTVLPTIFSNILNMEETLIFKIIYPLIFSLVPLALYSLYQRQWGKKFAFISVLFFISNEAFFDFPYTVKALIAELFYVLLFLVLLKKDMNQGSKFLILIFFHFALTTFYYTMNYLFLIQIFSIWLCGKIFTKNRDKKINLLTVVYFFVLTFLWYIYVAKLSFEPSVLIIKWSFRDFFEELLILESRGVFVLSAVGAVSPPSFLHQIGRIVFDVTALFILFGFIKLIVKDKEKFDPEYFLLTCMNMAILLAMIIIPSLNVLRIDRMYHVTLMFLSPLFILGGEALFKGTFKILPFKKETKRESCSLFLILIVLVTFFLFQTGFVYEITRDPVPSSISLSKYRIDPYTHTMLGLIYENDFFGAMWLSNYGDMKHTQIYSDVKSKTQVLTDSMVDVNNNVNVLSNRTVFANPSYIYLSRFNIMTGILLYDTMHRIKIQYNISEIYVFNSTMVFNNKLYSNGACEIYYYVP